VRLAPAPGQARKPHSRLGSPTVVAASVTFRPIASKLARPPRSSQHTLSRLQPPAVFGAVATPFLAAPVTVRITRAKPPPRTDFRLAPPAVVAGAITFRPLAVSIAEWKAPRLTRSTVRPPTVVTAAGVLAPFAPVTIRLARPLASRRNTYKLRGPAILGASVVFGPLEVRLARTPPQARKTTSRLQPPASLAVVVQALLAPITTRLARVKRIPRAQTRLRPPAVVGASVTFRPLAIKLVRRPRQAGAAKSIVGKLISGLAQAIPSFWLEGDQASATFDGDQAAGSMDDLMTVAVMDADSGEASMDTSAGAQGILFDYGARYYGGGSYRG